MPTVSVGLHLPQAVAKKLTVLAARSLRNKSDVVTLLLLSAEATADGGLRVVVPRSIPRRRGRAQRSTMLAESSEEGDIGEG